MNLNRSGLLAAFTFLYLFSHAQKNDHPILLKSGAIHPVENIRASAIDSFNKIASRYHSKAYLVLQFESIPGFETKKLLAGAGITLLDYLPVNSYTASISYDLDLNTLKQAHVRAFTTLAPQQKMEAQLAIGNIPSWAIKIPGTVDVWISFPKTFKLSEVTEGLKKLNIDIISVKNAPYRILELRLATNRIYELASLPFIEYVQSLPKPVQPLNYGSRGGSGALYLNADIGNGGKGLNGEGVVLGIGDDEDVQTHVDFSGRLIDRCAMPLIYDGHGTHTTGTLAGAGNIIEEYRGYASRATIVSQAFNGIINDAAAYVNDYGMVVTNNSYGIGFDCNYDGTYDLISRMLDQQAVDHPYLQHVFAAGNSGGGTCPPYPYGFKTVFGSFQSAKNIIDVGATSDSGLIGDFSSKGPVKDGRIKPEIMAKGYWVASTWPVNTYNQDIGTSMAAPAVAGGLGLLYQRYRQLKGGANPKSGLMKAILCNGAIDRGNVGPDFSSGYGWMNLYRSVDMLDNNHYLTGSSSNATTNNHTINVPANTAQLKILLYWTDPPASVLSSQTLVNDLDLKVIDPSSAVYFPQILDTTAANVNNPATTGPDHINNIEQVLINNPAAGSYTVQVTGTAITQNPSQEYYVVYDPIPVHIKILGPGGGEGVINNNLAQIRWNAFGLTGTATLEYSIDNGSTWNTIQTGVDINRDLFTWYVPNVVSDKALIRITKDITNETTTSDVFTILGQPTVSLNATQCESYINVDWTAVAGATDYEVMILRGTEMQSVATTTSTNYSIGGLSKDSTYWVTVRARINGKAGLRPTAISRQPNSGTCTGSISDNDLKLDAIISPVTGRKFTSTQLSTTSSVIARIKNLDDAPSGNFTVSYSLNGGSWVTENVATPIAAGSTYTHTFASTIDLSAAGTYNLAVVVKNSNPDPIASNDTAYAIIKSLDNQPLDLTSAFIDNIETAASATYMNQTMGINGIDRYDLSSTTLNGRLRTFVNSGIAYSGSKGLTLDNSIYDPSGNTNYLAGTFNLSSYNVAANDLRLDFEFNNHGQIANPANKVWIRGNDTYPWIQALNLDSAENDPGTYKKSTSIELSRLLSDNGQDFSTSFQVKWGQFGQIGAIDPTSAAGYTFDDIRLYQAVHDMQLRSIDSPTVSACGLSNTSTIVISIRNSSNVTLNNVPVRYRVNGGAWISETIPSIGANTILQHSFTTTADLSAFSTYNLQALVDEPTDNFRDNDTLTVSVINSPVISSFPYLENFEAGTGYWYTAGKNDSWEYGTPNSTKINRAASGAKAWKTRLIGNYNDYELSYLYSPCFNISSMTKPTLSFNVALDLEDCGATLCDGAWVEYSSDGNNWIKLGALGNGTNWYNKTSDSLWSIRDYTRWHVATIPLPTGINNLHIRFVMQSDPATNYEGIAIDDIHIYDNLYGIYSGPSMTGPTTQSVSGSSWVDILSPGNQLIASIQPNGLNLGTTKAQTYININNGNVRHTLTQYYHDRNISIKPQFRTLSDSVTVRYYFLDTETDSLIKATGCGTCSKPNSVEELGISKYTDADTSVENGTIADDYHASWLFITPDNVTKVPFDKGYYAEFKVKDFSEFWLNNGGFSNILPLPVNLIDFNVQKQGVSDVLVSWTTAAESNVDRYEIEESDGPNPSTLLFTKIGSVPSKNNPGVQNYNFTDISNGKAGTRYYRLKTVNVDGSYNYSPVKSVKFDAPVDWQVYPNPSNGIYHLLIQTNTIGRGLFSISDSKGALVKESYFNSNGSVQKLNIDLSSNNYAKGVYILQVKVNERIQIFKLYKE